MKYLTKLKGWKLYTVGGMVVLAVIGSGYGLYQLYVSYRDKAAAG